MPTEMVGMTCSGEEDEETTVADRKLVLANAGSWPG
jgi:hypothetical protein